MYVYTPLPPGCIRVLRLEPGEFGSPLRGSLWITGVAPIDYEFSDTTSASDGDSWSIDDDEEVESSIGHGSSDRDALHTTDDILTQEEPSSMNTAHDFALGHTVASGAACADLTKEDDVEYLPEVPPHSTGIPTLVIDDEQDEYISYEALSYAWGQPLFEHVIQFDADKTLAITTSLHAALQHLRLEHRERWLWADAICINQIDLEEKSLQIPIMAKIYQAAENILLWLGPSEESDTLAFMTIAADTTRIAHLPHTLKAWGEFLCDLGIELKDKTCCECCSIATTVEPSGKAGLQAVGKLLDRPWFSRLWVYQEIDLGFKRPMQVVSGHHLGSFARLLRTVTLYSEAHGFGVVNDDSEATFLARDDTAMILREVRPARPVFHPMLALQTMILLHDRKCSDHRDRVNALFSMLGLNRVNDFRATYSKSAAELYQHFLVTCVQHIEQRIKSDRACRYRGTTAISYVYAYLAFVGTEAAELGNRSSSWVPHLQYLTPRSLSKFKLYCLGTYYDDKQYRSNGQIVDPYRCAAEEGILELKGRVFGTVERVLADSQWPCQARHVQSVNLTEAEIQGIVGWYSRCYAFVEEAGLFMSQMKPGKVMERILMCDFVTRQLDSAGQERFQQLKARFDAVGIGNVRIPHSVMARFVQLTRYNDAAEISYEDVLDYDRNLCYVDVAGKREVAWVPQRSQPGDRLCVFADCPFPFVIRAAPDTSGSHQLVGDAWIWRVSLAEALGGAICDTTDIFEPSRCVTDEIRIVGCRYRHGPQRDWIRGPCWQWNAVKESPLRLCDHMGCIRLV